MAGLFKKSNFLYLGIGAILFAVLPLYFIYDPGIPGVFPGCPFYSITGLYCTGCGSQRALHDLLHMDLAGAMQHNLLFIPALLLAAYHLTLKILNSITATTYDSIIYHTKTPRRILIVILVFTVLRNIHSYPFSELAP